MIIAYSVGIIIMEILPNHINLRSYVATLIYLFRTLTIRYFIIMKQLLLISIVSVQQSTSV